MAYSLERFYERNPDRTINIIDYNNYGGDATKVLRVLFDEDTFYVVHSALLKVCGDKSERWDVFRRDRFSVEETLLLREVIKSFMAHKWGRVEAILEELEGEDRFNGWYMSRPQWLLYCLDDGLRFWLDVLKTNERDGYEPDMDETLPPDALYSCEESSLLHRVVSWYLEEVGSKAECKQLLKKISKLTNPTIKTNPYTWDSWGLSFYQIE